MVIDAKACNPERALDVFSTGDLMSFAFFAKYVLMSFQLMSFPVAPVETHGYGQGKGMETCSRNTRGKEGGKVRRAGMEAREIGERRKGDSRAE